MSSLFRVSLTFTHISSLPQVSLSSSSSLSPLRSSRYSSGMVKRTASDGQRYNSRLSTSPTCSTNSPIRYTSTAQTTRVSRSTSSGFQRQDRQESVKVSQISKVIFLYLPNELIYSYHICSRVYFVHETVPVFFSHGFLCELMYKFSVPFRYIP